MSNPFHAAWTAQGHNICLGNWEITFEGRRLTLEPDRGNEDMGTQGNFSYIFPDDDDFIEGLSEDDWILENVNWVADLFAVNDIPIDEQHMRWFYQAVNASDWRCGSCGGCI